MTDKNNPFAYEHNDDDNAATDKYWHPVHSTSETNTSHSTASSSSDDGDLAGAAVGVIGLAIICAGIWHRFVYVEPALDIKGMIGLLVLFPVFLVINVLMIVFGATSYYWRHHHKESIWDESLDSASAAGGVTGLASLCASLWYVFVYRELPLNTGQMIILLVVGLISLVVYVSMLIFGVYSWRTERYIQVAREEYKRTHPPKQE